MELYKCIKRGCKDVRIAGSIFCTKHQSIQVISLEDLKGYKRPKRNNTESELQISCINWFREKFPKQKHLLFSIPNGGFRAYRTAKTLKLEGTRAGVSDLFLMMGHESSHGLWIEMKAEKGILSHDQKEFQQDAVDNGYTIAVCRSLDEFKNTITKYFKYYLDN